MAAKLILATAKSSDEGLAVKWARLVLDGKHETPAKEWSLVP
jgi:hypothetical protein